MQPDLGLCTTKMDLSIDAYVPSLRRFHKTGLRCDESLVPYHAAMESLVYTFDKIFQGLYPSRV